MTWTQLFGRRAQEPVSLTLTHKHNSSGRRSGPAIALPNANLASNCHVFLPGPIASTCVCQRRTGPAIAMRKMTISQTIVMPIPSARTASDTPHWRQIERESSTATTANALLRQSQPLGTGLGNDDGGNYVAKNEESQKYSLPRLVCRESPR